MTITDNKKAELSKEKINFHLKRTRYLFNEFYITSRKYKTISYLRRNAAGWLIMNIINQLLCKRLVKSVKMHVKKLYLKLKFKNLFMN